MSARSIAQDAATMNSRLDSIWRMGDRDECSVKHIGWATAAIGAGLGWSDGLDYGTPWDTDGSPAPQRVQRLADKWGKVVAYRDTYGVERFDEVMRATKFNWYYEQYLTDMTGAQA
jgi:hypothetical protein